MSKQVLITDLNFNKKTQKTVICLSLSFSNNSDLKKQNDSKESQIKIEKEIVVLNPKKDKVDTINYKKKQINFVNSENSETFCRQNQLQIYQPNFILPNKPKLKFINTSFSFTESIQSKLLINTSPKVYKHVDSLAKNKPLDYLIFQSTLLLRVLFIYLISILENLIESVAYQVYLNILAFYVLVIDLPDYFVDLKNKLFDTINILMRPEIRDLWLLNLKIELLEKINFFKIFFETFLIVIKRAYLFIIVLSCLSLLNIISLNSTTKTSTLAKVIDNYSVELHAKGSDKNFKPLSISFFSNSQKDQSLESSKNIKKIILYKANSKTNLENLAEMYSLSKETILFNNNLSDNENLENKDIYLPWENGYIYHAETEIAVKDLAKIYQIDAQKIIKANADIYDIYKESFSKDSLILLPTENFEKIAKIKEIENKRKRNLQEAENQRQKMLAYRAVSISEETKTRSNNVGFIWPTVGSISRCLQPGHIACDIANFSAPPIFSVKQGVVLEAGWKNGGFGNMVSIDHGHGIKTVYMHMSELYVIPGQIVQQGEAIGKMGCTGNCTGTHLHFEVWVNGVQENPLLYLP